MDQIRIRGRITGALFASAVCIVMSSCASAFNDQAPIGNTGNRLVVGHDGGPFAKVWVLESGKYHAVKVVEAKK